MGRKGLSISSSVDWSEIGATQMVDVNEKDFKAVSIMFPNTWLLSTTILAILSFQKEFLDKYESFVQLVVKIYPNETIPSVAELKELLANS